MNEAWESIVNLCDCSVRHTFGEKITYYYSAEDSAQVVAVVSEAHVAIDSLSHPSISTQNCAIDLKRKDLKRDPKAGDKVTLREKLFQVIDVQMDSHGGVKLILMRA